MQVRRPVDWLLQGLRKDRRLVELLAALVMAHLLTLVVPQSPIPVTAEAAFHRWLAELRPVWGTWTNLLARSGLLVWRTSVWNRLLMSGLALVTIAHGERWIRERRHSRTLERWAAVLVLLGGLLVIGGWGAQLALGWAESGVVTWPGETITLPERGQRLSPYGGGFGWWHDRYGFYLIPRSEAVGVEIRAQTIEGTPLLLSPSAHSDPLEMLRLALVPQNPDAYFALPDAGLIFRANALFDRDPAPTQVQIYRSASGQLLREVLLEGESAVEVEGVEALFEVTSLARFDVVYNPGAFPEGVGMVLFALGALLLNLWQTPEVKSVSADMESDTDEMDRRPGGYSS